MAHTDRDIEGKASVMAATQKKTFTRWVNYFLSERMLKINDLFTDFKDGRLLVNLLELISSKKVGKYNENPKIQMHELENLTLALDFLKAEGLKTVGIGPKDIHDGNPKLILGLIWTIILRYQIQSGGDGASPKQELLEWVNRQIAPYGNLGIGPAEDFTKSWQDGKILSALADSLKPGLIDCKNLKNPLGDTTKAMNLAEKEMQIPQLVDAADMVHNPDEHSNMTYISYFRDYMDREKKRKGEVATKGPRANMCFAKGRGVEGGFARRPLPFTIYSRTVNDEPVTQKFKQDFKVVVSGPTGVVPNEYKDNGDGTFFCKYVAPVSGPYKVAIDLIGNPDRGESSGPIKGSVYNVQIREPSDPKSCWAEGPGLIKSFEGRPAYFTVHTRDKDGKPVPGDNVRCEVQLVEKAPDAPGGNYGDVPVDVKDNNDGTYSVRYDPMVAGKYKINVTVGDNQSIRDMPKIVPCFHPPDPKQSIARGPGVTPGEPVVGREAPFAVIVKDKNGNTIPCGGHDLKVTVTGPSGPIPCEMKDENNGIYQCKYLPKEPGLHVVDCKLEGQGIKDNPFRINIATPSDPSKSWAEGPGLHQAFDNRPAKFRVHVVDRNGKPVAGEPVEVKVLPKAGGNPAQVNINDNGDGTYDVAYIADTPGKWMIHTTILNQPIRDMPKEVPVYPCPDPQKTIVEGPGVTGGYVNQDLPFTIRSMDKHGKPVPVGGEEYKVNVTGPDGNSFPVDVKDNGDGTYSGSYRVNKPGDYKVMVHNKLKQPVGKSPYTAKVRYGADPGKCFAVGRGWKEAWDYLPAKFTIHCKDVNGNPVPGEIVRVVFKNVTPPNKRAELEQELGKVDDYLRKRKVDKVQKVQAEMKKAALDAKREAEQKGLPYPPVHIEEGSDVPVEVRDNGDGTYLAQYVATTPGIYKASVQVGEGRGHIKDSPKDIPVYVSRPKVVFWKHTYDQDKRKLAALEALLEKNGLSLPPD